MKPVMRTYQSEEDYWQIRTFLREVSLLDNRCQLNWPLYRFDYWRWHAVPNVEQYPMEEVLFIWEMPDKQIAAVLNPEGKGEAFLHVHPALRTSELEEEMLMVAEKHLAVAGSNGRRRLRVWANEQDGLRQALLKQRGYAKSDWPEYQRRRSLDMPILEAPLATGYTIRALGDGVELLERCYASGLVFHPDEIGYAIENRADVSWYRNIQNAPLYRRDLDLVAIAPDGAIAAFCTIWLDDVTRTGAFEPVGTVPVHQRRGLGKAIMCEGLRRLKRMGATMAWVSSYSAEAGALYASVGFTEFDLIEAWSKEL